MLILIGLSDEEISKILDYNDDKIEQEKLELYEKFSIIENARNEVRLAKLFWRWYSNFTVLNLKTGRE